MLQLCKYVTPYAFSRFWKDRNAHFSCVNVTVSVEVSIQTPHKQIKACGEFHCKLYSASGFTVAYEKIQRKVLTVQQIQSVL